MLPIFDRKFRAAAAWLAAWLCLGICPPAQARPTGPSLTVLAINDVYRSDLLPHVRGLRAALERQEGEVLLLHAGDFLFPSLLSQRFDGEQMIAALNGLDGDAEKFDPRMFITFGNHEFDKSALKHAAMLGRRIGESQFTWLGTNVRFRSEAGRPLVQADNLLSSALLTVNGIRVGLVSATTDSKSAEYLERFVPPGEALRAAGRELRHRGAQVVIALTHQTMAEDRQLLLDLGADAPDLIVGGHEHERQTALVEGRRIVKADADAASAAVIRLTPRAAGPARADLEYVDLPSGAAADPALALRVEAWQRRFERETCAARHEPADCLSRVLGRTQVELIGEELTIRRFETNLGNWLADLARAQFAARGAQVAFLNAGSIRLNRNLPAGPIVRQDLETLFAYPMRLVLLKLSGRQLQAVVDRAIREWTGNGHWLQISGFAFRHDPQQGRAGQLSLIVAGGLRPVRPDETILAVTNEYLIDRGGDRDGYLILDETLLAVPPATPADLKESAIAALRDAATAGIAPQAEGRICNSAIRGAPCLLPGR